MAKNGQEMAKNGKKIAENRLKKWPKNGQKIGQKNGQKIAKKMQKNNFTYFKDKNLRNSLDMYSVIVNLFKGSG